MNEPKPFASLGPTLLARKGGAKPAMRPQVPSIGMSGGGAQGAHALKQDFDALEDLGWNDMGEDDAPADRSAEVVALTPSPSNPVAEAETDAGSPKALVRSMHEELAELLEKGEAAPPVPKPKPKSEAKPDTGSSKPVVRSIHEELAELIEKGETELPVPRPKPPKPQPKPAPAAVSRKVRETAEEKALRRAAFTLRLDAKRHLKLRLASTVKNRSAQQLVTAALDKYLAEIPEVEALAAQVKRN